MHVKLHLPLAGDIFYDFTILYSMPNLSIIVNNRAARRAVDD